MPRRTPDDSALTKADGARAVPSDQVDTTTTQDTDAAAIERAMEPAPRTPQLKERVSALREMGPEQFLQRSYEVAGHIVTLIHAAVGGPLPPLPEIVRQSDTGVRERYTDSVKLLRNAEIMTPTDDNPIVIDTSFDPVCPVSLLIKRGDEVVYGGIHWALWKTIETSLSPEDKEFMRNADVKANVEKRIDDYERARTYLQHAGIDLNKPQLFDET